MAGFQSYTRVVEKDQMNGDKCILEESLIERKL